MNHNLFVQMKTKILFYLIGKKIQLYKIFQMRKLMHKLIIDYLMQ